MFFEQIYEVDEDGKEHLVKLAPRMPLTLESIEVDRDGGLKGIKQRSTHYDTDIFIPVDRLVAYVYEPRDSSWVGSSILRPTYKHWVIKDELIRLEISGLDRNSMGIPVYKGSNLTNDPAGDLQAGQEIVENIRAGDNTGASIPAGSDLMLMGVNGQLQSPQSAIRYHEEMIKKAALAHFMNLSGEGGSYSLASEQSQLFYQSLQSIADWIGETATQYIVQDLIEIAYPDYEGAIPRIVCEQITLRNNLTAQELAVLVQNKVLLVDSVLEEHVRRLYNLPPKKPLEQALIDKAVSEDLARRKLEKKGLELPAYVAESNGEEVKDE